MALPPHYTSNKAYFKDCLEFLNEYQWIYNYPNTDILINKVFDKIPREWIKYFQEISNDALNNMALGSIEDSASPSLKDFVNTVNKLKPKFDNNEIECIKLEKSVGLNKKKAHEIAHLAPIIHNICKAEGVRHIIDIGAGLGYLPQLLFAQYGYKVLGIEGNKKYVETAIKNQNKMYPNSKKMVNYVHHFVSDKSFKEISDYAQTTFKDFDSNVDKICVVALHACADLTVDILNIFKKIPIAKCAIVMPCCYHRMQECNNTFVNFPLSNELKDMYNEIRKKPFLTGPFLRLACQQTNSLWKSMTKEEHSLHAKNCLFRNILQEIVSEGKIKVTRQKRKTGYKNLDYNINAYLADLQTSYQFKYESGEKLEDEVIADIKKRIHERYFSLYRETECLIEALTAFQALIQIVCENIVLLDRCEYMNNLCVVCKTIKVTDDGISPRCFALVVKRD